MNTFRMQCINYLLANGWEQDVDGWEWQYRNGLSWWRTDELTEALALQFDMEDSGDE